MDGTKFITDREAAHVLGIKPEDVRRAVREGRLPGVIIHRKAVRINADALAAWRATEGDK
jgi:excisionase family DNA binding protein